MNFLTDQHQLTILTADSGCRRFWLTAWLELNYQITFCPFRAILWSSYASVLGHRTSSERGRMLKALWLSLMRRYQRWGSVSRFLCLTMVWNQITCDLLIFGICQVVTALESLKCCGSCEFDRARCCQEIEGKVQLFQKRHIQLPNSPFCDCSSRQSLGILAACTILCLCTLWMALTSIRRDMIRNPLAWLSRLWSECSR